MDNKREALVYDNTNYFGLREEVSDFVKYYLGKYGIEIYRKEFIGYNEQLDASCYTAGFRLNGKELITKGFKECCWQISDKAKNNLLIIKNNSISFYRFDPLSRNGESRVIKYNALRNGLALESNGMFGMTTKLEIIQDNNGVINIKFFYVDCENCHWILNRPLTDLECIDTISELLISLFPYNEYVKSSEIYLADLSYLTIEQLCAFKNKCKKQFKTEFGLIKAMLSDPMIEATIDRLLKKTPVYNYRRTVKSVNKIYEQYNKLVDDNYFKRKQELNEQRERDLALVKEAYEKELGISTGETAKTKIKDHSPNTKRL